MKKSIFKVLCLTLIMLLTLSTVAFALPGKYSNPDKVRGEVKVGEKKEHKNYKMEERIKNDIKEKMSNMKEFKAKIMVNKKEMKCDVPPVIKDGRTLIPLRAIMNGFGATVTWDQVSKAVYLVKQDIKITIFVGSNTIYVNEKQVTLDVPAQMISNRTFVPLRFISEVLGNKVNYDATTGDIEIEERLDVEEEVELGEENDDDWVQDQAGDDDVGAELENQQEVNPEV
ncbi:copper amine oxidase N-terminal domain-containing protein [Thermosediminibacter oceani]|uniref:Copper amine oxidase domain protein n=1 Tax=Thermosediminibacter oceani (strain ATCC BAA-1034 / DSM 16646 / JW/IW-1228P) TaxID=555079 RepID=D9S1X5_THEOJ|nr:copper amine oxidase N-terminal domain-containing protein [Thermosediminibacter oceani]ADL07402.1 copper amine oxidase domain protein [Thermosediminibacter oceani DSM 16646]